MLLNVTENIVFVTFCVKFYLKHLKTVIFRLFFCFVCMLLLLNCMNVKFSFHAGDDCLI